VVGAPSTITSQESSPSYFLKFGSTSVLGEDYEQIVVDKKCGRVRFVSFFLHSKGGPEPVLRVESLLKTESKYLFDLLSFCLSWVVNT